MKILIVEPGRKPRPAEIDGTVEAMREIVGGKFQAMYPAEDVALVFNNDPNVPLPPQNREVRNDIVSLTDEQLRHYMKVFALPEVFLNLGGRTIVLPCREEGSYDDEG